MNRVLAARPAPVLDALDLFCGAGGLSLGFLAGGFHVMGMDCCADAVKTYRTNVGAAVREDLFKVKVFPPADVVIAGPPCQPWSRAGKRGGVQDKRDGLAIILEAVRQASPIAVVVENVPDLARPGSRAHVDAFERDLEGHGYVVEEQVLNASEYGVPQRRRRIFITAMRGGTTMGKPRGWLESVTVRRAIPGTYWRDLAGARCVSDDMNTYIERYERASGCMRPRDLRLDEPARTLTARNLGGATGDMVRLCLPNGRRRTLTVREAARLQAFPDGFRFIGSQRSKFDQIGNAVPPLLALAVARAVLARIGVHTERVKGSGEGIYPVPSSAAATATMKANRRRDTMPERRVRSALHRCGRRFRIDVPVEVPGRRVRPDIVFSRHRVAVFIDGCFWHGCPMHGQVPRANAGYWQAKLERNKARDHADDEALRSGGWKVLRLWEHEATEAAVATILNALGGG